MKIYIVRHGEVPQNVNKQYNRRDDDLTKNGMEQAKKLRDEIKNMNFDIVFCSPLQRARHTANIINGNKAKIIIDSRLTERNCGDLGGHPIEITNRDEYWNYNTAIQYGTAENIRTFFERVYEFLDELKTKDYESVLIVAHSGVSKAFSAYFEGINDGLFLNRGLKNCGIKEYEFKRL